MCRSESETQYPIGNNSRGGGGSVKYCNMISLEVQHIPSTGKQVHEIAYILQNTVHHPLFILYSPCVMQGSHCDLYFAGFQHNFREPLKFAD